MKKKLELLVVVVAALVAMACGGAGPQSTATQNLDIAFKSEPDPPKMGENTFEVMVMANGQPVSDADVAVEFFMAAMPSMKMAEMRNSVPLKHEGDGRYRGAGNVMMAGAWDATVTVKRGGQDVGSRKFTVTAK